MPDGPLDDDLLAALREAMKARSEVPPGLVEAASNAYTWRTIDAELAELTYDSDSEVSVTTRSESASIRALTFTSARFTMEVEVTTTSLIGQVIPPRAGTIEAQTRDGTSTLAQVDDIGCFSVEPIPAVPFRLHYRSREGADVVTGWITL
jgi:hypothetical protein